MQALYEYLHQSRQQHLDDLLEFLRIPSISAQVEHRPDIERAADFLCDEFTRLGLAVEKITGEGNPLVYAQTELDPARPTVLIYGHYDVQPVDPENLWNSPPFEPLVKDGIIYARGSSDDKGQVYAHVKAVEAYVRTGRRLPVNVKFLIEGEEEKGGHSVYEYTEKHPEKLACDAVLVSDTSLYNEDTPAITFSLRGMCYTEITVEGPAQDLHSGSFGGTVRNPGNAIAAIVASLHDEHGRVRVPGFYDDVVELDAEGRAEFERLKYGEAEIRRDTGSPASFGEAGYTTLERMWVRPTCDVNGLWSGYTGEGGKTIIPAKAGAKVSMRLVPNQDPDKIAKAFSEFVIANAPSGVRVKVEILHNAKPVLVPRDSAMMRAGLRALQTGFGKKALFIGEGGSIPITGTFQECLKVPVIMLGYGLPNDNIHSPNEKFHLDNYYNGIRTTVAFFDEASKLVK
jgi:acetylornithine deacetylase/succinyl-diaminopimelate desuccinylase-like protein